MDLLDELISIKRCLLNIAPIPVANWQANVLPSYSLSFFI